MKLKNNFDPVMHLSYCRARDFRFSLTLSHTHTSACKVHHRMQRLAMENHGKLLLIHDDLLLLFYFFLPLFHLNVDSIEAFTEEYSLFIV